ncbi:hypothetical protein DEM27_00230 [Metarhizobium album]|uniref:Lipoprotein n=1 Tax=Metarhizobium album TaxID=2182425 RepID=A0A2U2DWJ3_9HYPH|nr:hypothetical protein [Rhizobium album]PWE57676.1 hypothetical protein DEM27_00230 [Rhizobium album]
MHQVINRTVLALILTYVSMGAACGTTAPASVPGLRRVVGTDLIGAHGATPADQRKINRTVVGICAAKVWTADECGRHGEATQ